MPVAEALAKALVTPELLADLKRDEGLRLRAYPDPLSEFARGGKGRGDPWTIGYGHTGPDVKQGVVWTEAQAEAALEADALKHAAELVRVFPWVCLLDPIRQRVLCNMAFNLGVAKLGAFRNTLLAIQTKQWGAAADGLLNSVWAAQVKGRATRLAKMMLEG